MYCFHFLKYISEENETEIVRKLLKATQLIKGLLMQTCLTSKCVFSNSDSQVWLYLLRGPPPPRSRESEFQELQQRFVFLNSPSSDFKVQSD